MPDYTNEQWEFYAPNIRRGIVLLDAYALHSPEIVAARWWTQINIDDLRMDFIPDGLPAQAFQSAVPRLRDSMPLLGLNEWARSPSDPLIRHGFWVRVHTDRSQYEEWGVLSALWKEHLRGLRTTR